MAQFAVIYSVTSDFGGDDPNLSVLHQSILLAEDDGDFTGSTFVGIERGGDEIRVIFDRADGGPLPAGQKTTLDGLVTGHVPANPDAGLQAKELALSAGTSVTIRPDDPGLLLVTASGVGSIGIWLPFPGREYRIKRLDSVATVNINVRVLRGGKIDLLNGVRLGLFPESLILVPYEDGYVRM